MYPTKRVELVSNGLNGLKDYAKRARYAAEPRINLRTVADAHSADRPQQQLTTVLFLRHTVDCLLDSSADRYTPAVVFYSFSHAGERVLM